MSWRNPGLRTTSRIILQVASITCGLHLFTKHVAQVSFMDGPSMLPTLANSGELVIDEYLTYRFRPIYRGDLVVFKSPLDPKRIVCKRVIGVPGDTVCVDPTGALAPSTEHVVIPKGHIWVSGDNMAASRDSREYGPLPIGLVTSRLAARIWPPLSFTIFCNSVTYID